MDHEGKSGMDIRLERIEHCLFGNGQPGLEVKLRQYIDERDAHKEANLRQDIGDLRTIGDHRHNENSGKLDEVVGWKREIQGSVGMAKWMGGAIMAMVMAILALLSYLAANRPHAISEHQPPAVSSSQQPSSDAGVDAQ